MKDKAGGTIALDGLLWLHWILHTWRRVIQVFLLPIFVNVLFIIGLGLLYFYFREPRWWVRWVWSVAFGGLGVVGITTGFDWVVLRIWDLWLRHHVDVQAPFRANENIYESLPEVPTIRFRLIIIFPSPLPLLLLIFKLACGILERSRISKGKSSGGDRLLQKQRLHR